MKKSKKLLWLIIPITMGVIFLLMKYFPIKKITTDALGVTSNKQMKLKLVRKIFTEISTIGELYIDGVFFCYTLEDKVRTGVKVPHLTAIPYGIFPVVQEFSNRFQKIMPRLKNVPDFSGILIHNGNYSGDTDGCILVGSTKGKDFVGNSVETFKKLLPYFANKTDVTIEITK